MNSSSNNRLPDFIPFETVEGGFIKLVNGEDLDTPKMCMLQGQLIQELTSKLTFMRKTTKDHEARLRNQEETILKLLEEKKHDHEKFVELQKKWLREQNARVSNEKKLVVTKGRAQAVASSMEKILPDFQELEQQNAQLRKDIEEVMKDLGLARNHYIELQTEYRKLEQKFKHQGKNRNNQTQEKLDEILSLLKERKKQ